MQKSLLVIGAVWPEPTSSAAGWRMLQIMQLLDAKGFQLHFACAAQKSEHSTNWQGLAVQEHAILLNDSSFDVWISNLNPSAVLFDRFMIEEQFGWRVAEFAPNALRILDTEDLHCLRLARQKAVKENRAFTESDLFSDEAKREIASIFRCDMTLMISFYEMTLLQSHFQIPKSQLFYLPFLVEINPEPTPSFSERQHFVTIGNFIHPPNWDAVQQLKTEIWPLIRKKLPNAEMHVHGAYSSRKVDQLHKPSEGFYIKGRAEDAREVIQNARVLLAPLRFGAGLKGKLLEAMLCETPAVTTTIGAEGMTFNKSFPGKICNENVAFAEAAIELYSNEIEWEQACSSCRQIANELFAKSKFEGNFSERISHLISNLKAHRQSNFVGSMLMHHTMKSTMFMAKWIEAKNAN